MSRVFDCFLFNGEIDLLRCRLMELADVVDRFIIVESAQTHSGRRTKERVGEWRSRVEEYLPLIHFVPVPQLLATAPIEREHEHREHIRDGLLQLRVRPNDIVMQSDSDEIPSASAVLALPERLSFAGLVTFAQRLHCFAVDWLHPEAWLGTTASRYADIQSFSRMREARGNGARIPNGGWHFSWLGTVKEHLQKLDDIYEGPEIENRVRPLLKQNTCFTRGLHVDGAKMFPMQVDDNTYPRFIRDGFCPKSWYRPRAMESKTEPRMKLGIPTLCRYDLLARLLASAEAGSLRPSGYVIIDNGGGLTDSGVVLPATTAIIHQGTNLGVAASWNRLLDYAHAQGEPIVIANDDIVFGEHTFREMAEATAHHDFVEGDGWSLFAQTPACTERVGPYDEHFWPAYYEDSDYDVRLALAGIPRHKALSAPFQHEGWATTRQLGDAAWLRDGREQCRQYFLRKWGDHILGTDYLDKWRRQAPGIEQRTSFLQPWNGAAPGGFQLRAPAEFQPLMRYDIINKIATRIGAKRYLEIGVAAGKTISRVRVHERVGVDPHPTPGGMGGATLFVSKTSDEFIASNPEPFDLVFLDGDHRAEVVLREACSVPLTEYGIIVIHDANPSTESLQVVPYQGGDWCGDVWKAIATLAETPGWVVSTFDTDYGVAVITQRGATPVLKPRTYQQLSAERSKLLGLFDPFSFDEWLDACVPARSR